MRSILLLGYLLLGLLAQPSRAQAGLRGDYYAGTNFERKIFSRIDPAIHFNWDRRNPGPGLSRSEYSIRWTGKLLAPTTGEFQFYAKVNDGIRVWVGNKLVLDSWHLNAYKQYAGSIVLEAGHYYDLRIDYFNAIEWGEIYLYWKPPTAKAALKPSAERGEPISANYFFQKAPQNRAGYGLAGTAVIKRSVVTAIPKPVHSPTLKSRKPKPVLEPVPSPKITVTKLLPTDSSSSSQVDAEPQTAITAGATLILRTVQFEQSSYVLLAEASTELNKLVQALEANPQWQVHIAGHTDNVGETRLNMTLSEQRAKVVAMYLIRQGIADERITTEGFGSTQPFGNNTTEEERSKNRRVTIVIH